MWVLAECDATAYLFGVGEGGRALRSGAGRPIVGWLAWCPWRDSAGRKRIARDDFVGCDCGGGAADRAVRYNGLVRLRVQCDNAWADIDVQLKRRYDLIPNLVETVKGYAAHEKGTFEAVIQARNSSMSAQGPAAKAEAEGTAGRRAAAGVRAG